MERLDCVAAARVYDTSLDPTHLLQVDLATIARQIRTGSKQKQVEKDKDGKTEHTHLQCPTCSALPNSAF